MISTSGSVLGDTGRTGTWFAAVLCVQLKGKLSVPWHLYTHSGISITYCTDGGRGEGGVGGGLAPFVVITTHSP